MNNDGSAGNVGSDLSAFVAAWCNRYAVTHYPARLSAELVQTLKNFSSPVVIN